MRAFVAVAGVLQNGKLVLCNFVVEISEGFWQFLIVCCGCSRKMQQNIDTAIQLVSVLDNLGKIWCRC